MNIFVKSRLAWELKRLARENALHGKPLTIMDDVVFKIMLTSDSEDSREALRSLLSACTKREVSKVKVLNNELLPAHLAAKFPRLDVHVTFNDGESADMEMQIGESDDNLKKRAAFYSAMLISGQSKRGEPYDKIKRVYQIFFLNTVLFPHSDKIPRRYCYIEKEEHDILTDITEIIFYEMPKLERKVRDFLSGSAEMLLPDDEKWCMFMKYWHEERAAPLIEKLYNEEEGIMRAGSALTKVDRDYIKFAKHMAEEKNRVDDYYRTLKLKQQVEAEVRAEVLAKMRAKVRTEIEAKALAEIEAEMKTAEIARNALAQGLSVDIIEKLTGLSHDEIVKL
ncbi:MAG: Rpn family recombination-promoting nuclease/putative transposase [Treponema sp.]|nr:Rpn family recombination-promoting nuclease/putative transposase [Treponema sp.]